MRRIGGLVHVDMSLAARRLDLGSFSMLSVLPFFSQAAIFLCPQRALAFVPFSRQIPITRRIAQTRWRLPLGWLLHL